jgi:hypothetical protein
MRARRWNTIAGWKLVEFIDRNPGLTASMIARLWKRPAGTISSVLYRMAKERQISRCMGCGEWNHGHNRVWRYYPDAARQAINDLLNQQST